MLLDLHPENPQVRNIKTVIDCLRNDGVIIYPTDTIYGLGCDIYNAKAIERICKIKNIDTKKAQFSFVCSDLSHLSDYTKGIDTPIFRMLKKALPGPYTFIFEASKEVPRQLKNKKETIGIRIPDHIITQQLVKELGHPIMSVSLPMDGDIEYYTDPEIMYEVFGKQVDIVLNSGIGNTVASTVIDCTSGIPTLIRQGAGDWESLLH